MTHPSSPIFDRLFVKIKELPVIDCHEHMQGPSARPLYKEPIAALIPGYVLSDLQSAGFGVNGKDVWNRLADPEVSTDDKWPLFERLWRATQHTAYARVTRLVLQNEYGVKDVTRASLDQVAEQLASRDEAAYFRSIDEANIQLMLVDVLGWLNEGMAGFLDGTKTFPEKWRILISLPMFHPPTFTSENITSVGGWADHWITSLEEYEEAVFHVFQRCIERGAIGIKDQSAYERTLDYEVVSRAEAEKLFNRVLSDPHNSLGWPDSKPLNDYLFHQYMRFARDLKLPVQLHTGHMAGIYNRVDKTNAAYLTKVLELHQEVRFDIFHGNWPYMGDLLFLAKNYPNVAIDCCWLHIIEPSYAVELLERAVQSVPHSKVHGFGGDYGDMPEFSAAHLQIARSNIATSLTHLVESGWLEEQQALTIAADWLFNNPNRFFNLGLEEIKMD